MFKNSSGNVPHSKIDKSVLDSIQPVPSKKASGTTNSNNSNSKDKKKSGENCIIY